LTFWWKNYVEIGKNKIGGGKSQNPRAIRDVLIRNEIGRRLEKDLGQHWPRSENSERIWFLKS
jgi:hypothetical protein